MTEQQREQAAAERTHVLRNSSGKYLDRYGGATWAVAGAQLFTEDEANMALKGLPPLEAWEKCKRPN